MKIFVCEFIAGGGLYRESLPSSLAHEGALMHGALLRDLSGLQGMEVTTTYDARLLPPQHADQAIPIRHNDDVWQLWHECILNADAVWPIAPETGGVLSKLTKLTTAHHKTLFGSSLGAVNLTTSKYATYQVLQAARISAAPTYTLANWPQNGAKAWVVKQDDGVGCVNSSYFESGANLLDWMRQGRETTHIIQPYLEGIPASISMLCKQGRAWVLSCNVQNVSLESGKFTYAGSVINGMAEHSQAFEAIASGVANAIPGLAGYVGVDLIVNGSEMHVLEVNPRLTTSYVGLREATDCNPAKLIVDLFLNESFRLPPEFSNNVVEFNLAD